MFPLGTSVPRRRASLVTGALIGLNLAAFGYQLVLPPAAGVALVERHGVVPWRQWAALAEAPGALDLWLWPLVTSMFLHGGLLHILGNLLFLWTFAPAVEERLGRWRFVRLYLGCGVVASLAQSLSDPGSVVPMIGASGAVAGVLGAFLILHPGALVVVLVPILFLPFTFTLPAVLFLVFWFLQQAVFAAADLASPMENQGGVAWWAHIGGFIAGMLGVLWLRRPPAPPSDGDAEVTIVGEDGRRHRYVVRRHPSRYGIPVPKDWRR